MFVCVSRSVMPDSLRPHGLQPAELPCPWDSPGKNTGVGCHFLLQGIFPTQGSNVGLPHCGQILHHLSHQGSPRKSLNGWKLASSHLLRILWKWPRLIQLCILSPSSLQSPSLSLCFSHAGYWLILENANHLLFPSLGLLFPFQQLILLIISGSTQIYFLQAAFLDTNIKYQLPTHSLTLLSPWCSLQNSTYPFGFLLILPAVKYRIQKVKHIACLVRHSMNMNHERHKRDT